MMMCFDHDDEAQTKEREIHNPQEPTPIAED